MHGRQIIESLSFQEAVGKLGGYRFVDEALATIMDGLLRNPYGFERFEHDIISFRFARTKRIRSIPPLVVIFRIDEIGNVYLEHIEEEEAPY